jgi:hypothetical protein
LRGFFGYKFGGSWVTRTMRGRQLQHLAELLRQSIPTFTYAVGALHRLTIRCHLLRNFQGMRALDQEALDRPVQAGYRHGIVFHTMVLGAIIACDGELDAGAGKLRAAYDTAEVICDGHWADWVVAGAYLDARLATEGSGFVERAISASAEGGRGRVIADLHRMKGEVILIAGGSLDEAAFKSAIAIARRQRAKSFERRASIRLARLLAQQGKRDEAHSMLSESTAGSPKASTPPT